MTIERRHITNAAKAEALYLDNMKPAEAKADWLFAMKEAREFAKNALRASSFLGDISGALKVSGAHTLIFRQILSPPLSQDQFKLICKSYSKSKENKGSPLKDNAAGDIAAIILERMDYSLTPWLAAKRRATRSDAVLFLKVISTLLAQQRIQTSRRNRLAKVQEDAVIDLLNKSGWAQLSGSTIDERGQVAAKSFMHKARFTTATTAAQEVDIACGLLRSRVLAMECKVTNDHTNSVKRINDVIKKSSAWKTQYGRFLTTAALLQGVIAAKDVQRLTDNDIEVFWSHDLDALSQWLDENAEAH